LVINSHNLISENNYKIMNLRNVKSSSVSKSLTRYQKPVNSLQRGNKNEMATTDLILRKNFTGLGLSKSPIHNKTFIPNKLENNGKFDKTTNDLLKEWYESDAKLNDTLNAFAVHVGRNEGSSANTLFRTKTVLLNWLRDADKDNLEYSKFMTEKKIKYLLRNKETSENKLKALEPELVLIKQKKTDLEALLGENYVCFETEELAQDIERFAQSYEIKSGKSTKMLEKFEEMKKMFESVKEYNLLKENESNKNQEIKEIRNIINNSLQTMESLGNYYKNIKNKINSLCVNINKN
jgi:hypothetical protein